MTGSRRWWMLSLESKLPLMVGGVLFLVIATLTLAAYLVATGAERSSATVRLDQDAALVASSLYTGIRGTRTAGRTLADHPDVRASVTSTDPSALRPALDRALVYRGPRPDLVRRIEVLDARAARVHAVGGTESTTPPLSVEDLSTAESTGFGALYSAAEIPVFPTVAAVRADTTRIGWIVVWWQLAGSVRLDNREILVGNGSVWTDLRGIVASPPPDVLGTVTPRRYARGAGMQLAGIARVSETPWLVLAQTPEAMILAPTRRFLGRVTGFALFLFAIACGSVWFLSRRMTRPLRHLTAASTAISAGDYSIHVAQTSHDEIGSLASAFNDMVGRVREAHRRVEDHASQYRMLFEDHPSPMWVFDRQSLRFLAVNQPAQTGYGYTLDEFLAMTVDDLDSTSAVSALRNGRRRHRRKDGTTMTVDVTSHDVSFEGRAATLVLALDVTERERSERELQSAHETLRAIVNEAPVAVYSLDTDGIVRSWNPAAERIFGWTAAETIGGPLPTLPPDAQRDPATRVQEVAEGRLLKGAELTRLRKDGTSVSVRLHAGLLHDASGAVTGIMVVAADITELRLLEHQYRQAQKMEAVGRLAGGIAHDFNNILTVILGESEMALQDMDGADPQRPALEEITKAGNRASQLTKQLLAFSRQQIVESRVFDLNDLVVDVERMLGRLIGENVRLEVQLDADAVSVRADRSQIEQVLMNLAVNARDAMPDGGVLTIQTGRVRVEADRAMTSNGQLRAGHYSVLSVHDSGTGMSEDVRTHIFEPFFTTKGPGRGTGLGLATCYGIVSQARGQIEVESQPGAGTRFRIYLPYTESAAPSRTDVVPKARSSGRERILLVEDQAGVRNVAARMLTGLGYQVKTTDDAEGALDLLRGEHEAIDLLLTDVILPGMNGRELAQRARLLQPGLKVLFASGYTGDVAAYQALVDADSALIQKPLTVSALSERVRQVLDQ